MSLPYAQRLPKDRAGESMQEYPPAVVALGVNSSENNAVSSLITLNDNTSTIEVASIGAGAVIKWITAGNTNASVISAAGTANYDHVIAPNTVRKFVVPIETVGVASIVGINKQAGLYNRVAVKSVGASSVMTSQY